MLLCTVVFFLVFLKTFFFLTFIYGLSISFYFFEHFFSFIVIILIFLLSIDIAHKTQVLFLTLLFYNILFLNNLICISQSYIQWKCYNFYFYVDCSQLLFSALTFLRYKHVFLVACWAYSFGFSAASSVSAYLSLAFFQTLSLSHCLF